MDSPPLPRRPFLPPTPQKTSLNQRNTLTSPPPPWTLIFHPHKSTSTGPSPPQKRPIKIDLLSLEVLSNIGAWVWRKAPRALPNCTSVLDKFLSIAAWKTTTARDKTGFHASFSAGIFRCFLQIWGISFLKAVKLEEKDKVMHCRLSWSNLS